ncbi:MAG TPA: TrmH family RNA methyltransferase [Gaiellaceae bacterium]
MARRRTIRSANADFQLALALRDNRRQRARQGRFLVEGVRSIDRAIENGWTIDSFWCAGERPLSRWATGLLEAGLARTHVELEPGLMSELSAKDETSELVALVDIPPDGLERIPRRDDQLLVVLDRPASPGNIGSVIRSADALGARGVVVAGHAADVYDPHTVRASQGSLFAVPVVRVASAEELEPRLEGLQVVGTTAHGDVELADVDLRRPTALVLGNETKGLSWGWRERSEVLVRIPQRGSASSLNLAAAGAILLYEAERQRAGGAA